MDMLRGSRVLITVPELKKSAIEMSEKDEEARMRDAMKQWEKLEVFAVGPEVNGIAPKDKVYIQTYALESGERIHIDGGMKILVPESAVALVWPKE